MNTSVSAPITVAFGLGPGIDGAETLRGKRSIVRFVRIAHLHAELHPRAGKQLATAGRLGSQNNHFSMGDMRSNTRRRTSSGSS